MDFFDSCNCFSSLLDAHCTAMSCTKFCAFCPVYYMSVTEMWWSRLCNVHMHYTCMHFYAAFDLIFRVQSHLSLINVSGQVLIRKWLPFVYGCVFYLCSRGTNREVKSRVHPSRNGIIYFANGHALAASQQILFY